MQQQCQGDVEEVKAAVRQSAADLGYYSSLKPLQEEVVVQFVTGHDVLQYFQLVSARATCSCVTLVSQRCLTNLEVYGQTSLCSNLTHMCDTAKTLSTVVLHVYRSTICHCCHTCCGKLIAFHQNKIGYWSVIPLTRPFTATPDYVTGLAGAVCTESL